MALSHRYIDVQAIRDLAEAEIKRSTIALAPMESLRIYLEKNKLDLPTPAYGESAGLDLYYPGGPLPKPGLIPTGMKIALPGEMVGLLLDRSSITKTRYIRRAGVIDPGYRGEIFVNLIDATTGDPVESLSPGKLPVQLVVVPFVNKFDFISEEELADMPSIRGERGFGSTNKE